MLARRPVCWMLFLFSLVLVACAPAATEPGVEPSVNPVGEATLAEVAPPAATQPPGPYPPPTRTPQPPVTPELPEPTDLPESTPVPVPTLPPTPVVTPIPTAVPPIIPLPEGTTSEPFTLYYRDGDVIRSLGSTGDEEAAVFFDPAAEFGLYLLPEEAYMREWGAVSPDGQQFAILLTEAPDMETFEKSARAFGIYLMDRESRDLRLLVRDGVEPVWSPNGQQIAYRSLATGNLWVAETATGKAVVVYVAPEAHIVTGFSWAPDSHRLVFIDQLEFDSRAAYVVDTSLDSAPVLLNDSQPYYTQWSPSGRYISFIATVGDEARSPTHVIDLENGNQTRISYEVYIAGCGPKWSPVSDLLAFDGNAVYEQTLYQSDIWLVDPTLTTLSRLTYDVIESVGDSQVSDVCPIWSPDGSQVVYWRDRDVFVHSLADGQSWKVATLPWSYGLGLVVAP